MMQDIILPDDLNTALASESKDFVVKGRFVKPLWDSMSYILMGAFWLFIIVYMGTGFNFSYFSIDLLKEIIVGYKEALINKEYAQVIFPVAFFGIFSGIGLYLLFYKGVRILLKKGGIFVGTPTKLYNYKGGHVYYTDWVEFTGNIKIKGNDTKGTLIIERTTGYMQHRNKSSSVYVPYTAYIEGIQNVNEIAKICKKRIAEANAGKYSD
jgi:hypothetical protein